jgi:hypothetical protein
MKWKKISTALLTALCLFIAGQVHAAMMQQLDLQELTGRADKIFRGTVIGIDEGTIEAGGGELPAVTYRIAVDEMFKGEATEVKGDEAVVVIRMIGSLEIDKANEDGNIRFSPFREVPRLSMGSDYVLFTTPESAIGLSVTVGLGQGAFSVYTVDGADDAFMAVNEFNNAGLGLNGEGPVEYDKLGAQIRALLGQ